MMVMNELTTETLNAANHSIGDGPMVMVNLLWFHQSPQYPDGFEDAQPSSRDAYYKGYAGAIRAVAEELKIPMNLVYAGDRLNGLLAGPDEDWDQIVMVRYENFGDFRSIVESDDYVGRAQPHRLAAVANWRFFATKSL